jgi:hypothetical protein
MDTLIASLGILLAIALLILGWSAYQNHLEIQRLRANGHRKISPRHPHH